MSTNSERQVPSICFYYNAQRSTSLQPGYKEEQNVPTNTNLDITLRKISQKFNLINSWIRFFELAPQTRQHLHNNNKDVALPFIRNTLLSYPEGSQPQDAQLFLNFLDDFSTSTETNLYAYAKEQQLQQSLDAAAAVLKQQGLDPKVECARLYDLADDFDTFSLPLRSKYMAKAAASHCSGSSKPRPAPRRRM